MDTDDRLVELAAILADGGTFDWATAESDPEHPHAIAHLRTIAEIARLHQTLSGSDPAADATASLVPPATWNGLQLLEVIGEGRFGTVYRAFDRSLDREIAVKLLHARDDADADVERVVEEGRLAARVRHANVVTIYGAGRFDGRTGIWMELIRGRTLEAELAANGPLSATAIRHIAVELSHALTAVHAAGLVHRDVKTTNAMREADGRVVLGDFGAGGDCHDADNRRAGLAGTPPYLAPEIFEGLPATPQSDFYSLGVVLFRLATGVFPVRGGSIGALRAAHATGTVASVRTLRRDLSPNLTGAVDRLLDPNPRRRYQSAAAVEAAVMASPRRPLTIAAAVIGIAIAGALLLWRPRQEPKREAIASPVHGSIAAGVGLARLPDAPNVHVPVGPVPAPGAATLNPIQKPAAAESGLRLEHIDPDFQNAYAIYAPSVDGRYFPCRRRAVPMQYVVAICDLERRSMTTIRGGATRAFGAQSARVSPDGRSIAYAWNDDDASIAVHVSLVDGSAERKLFEAQAVAIAGWTPDGRSVIVSDASGVARRMLEIPIDGGPPRVLWTFTASDRPPAVSPDGRSIAIPQGVDGEFDLHGFSVESGQLQWQLTLPGSQLTPVWLPSGRTLAFVSDHLGASSVMTTSIGADGRPSAPVVHHTIGRGSLSLRGHGGDGALYAWISPPTRDLFIATIDLASGASAQARMLAAGSIEDTMGADWSPDGRRVAYLRGKAGAPGGPANLVIKSVDDGRERAIPLPGFLQNNGPLVRWSPDGRLIAATFATGDAASGVRGVLGLLDMSRERIEVVATAGDVRTPSWDHATGELLYFADGEILRYRPGATETRAPYRPEAPQRISAFGGAQLSSAGTLAVALAGRACRVRIIERSGRTTDAVFEAGDCSALAWTPDGARLIVGIATRPPQLWTLDPIHGTRTRVSLEASRFWDLSINAAGQLLYTDGNRPSTLWRITGLPR